MMEEAYLLAEPVLPAHFSGSAKILEDAILLPSSMVVTATIYSFRRAPTEGNRTLIPHS